MNEQGEFKPGDVVVLKSGGPPMTIEFWSDTYEQWICKWFEGKKLESAQFSTSSLKIHKE